MAATTWIQPLRDNLVYASGYFSAFQARFPRTLSELYALFASKVVSPFLPFLSFLALPFFSGTSTTINLLFFYLTWSAIVLTHDQLVVELYGTLVIRLLCYLLPALGFLAFDCAAPRLSKGIKARGASQLPHLLGRNKLLEISGVAVANVLLAIALQAGLELLCTRGLHIRSILKVTSAVPLPWTILKDVASALAIRGVLVYAVHRYLLHTYDSPLKALHLRWQHSIKLPFSLVAAYDHPVNYLLVSWFPIFVPAYLFRLHVLEWHLLVALCSLEELFVFSGYAVLPSSILLVGMARRTDEHFAVVDEGKAVGNFGRFGILDFVCGTVCQDEGDAIDDIETEVEKHRVKERAESSANGAMAGIKGKPKSKPSTRSQSKKA